MVNLIYCSLVFLGSLLIGAPHYFGWGQWEKAIADFGIAALISGILGLTVEGFTRRRFAKEIAKDVFAATIGHLLPTEFQEEMRWIYDQDAICDDHDQHVRIEKVNATTVRFHCTMVRHIRNVTNENIDLPLGLGIDEWFADMPSEIHEFGYQIDDQPRIAVDLKRTVRPRMNKGRPVIEIEHQCISLRPGKKVITWTTFSEIKPINSDHHSHFKYATKNPRVRIQADSDIRAVAAFPRETELNKVRTSGDSYIYNGLVLPAQEIRVRWWEEGKRDAWLSSSAQSKE